MIQNELGTVKFNSNTLVQEYPSTSSRKKKEKTNLHTRIRSAEKESNHSFKKWSNLIKRSSGRNDILL
jgi:hypothetical protein